MHAADGIHPNPISPSTGEYVVVARRYRPQQFDQLVGQGHVSQALQNAINTNRVGHAYLFAGPRGIGKTSAARILAKALDCKQGPTPTPCDECDICLGVAVGADVDVLEIDGASNRGIDEIRQLRSNVNVRPSRARFKIYIIDEVHMLTTPAFNALLKTLEEPPDHVKFIFCTTDPEKIPITVLSRCQRFNFIGIRPDAIAQRLFQIAETEGVQIEPDALQLLARRAAGSMRDSQSLLEQLLAFGTDNISANEIHRMLGTADSTRLMNLVGCLVRKDPGAALGELDLAIREGVDAGPLVDQLLGYFRDMMAVGVGCDQELLLHCTAAECDDLASAAQQFGMETILAAIQVLDQTADRMRQSTHGRILLEMAVVRIAKLQDLEGLSQIIAQLQEGTPVSPSSPSRAGKKKIVSRHAEDDSSTFARQSAPTPKHVSAGDAGATAVATVSPPLELNDSNLLAIWKSAAAQLEGLIVDQALKADSVTISGPNCLVIGFPKRYNSCKTFCESTDRQTELKKALQQVTGRRMQLQFRTLDDDKALQVAMPPVVNRRQRMREVASHPTVRRAIELFDAELVRIDQPRDV